MRPYHRDSTQIHPNLEVKLDRARPVLEWGTIWEARVLHFFVFCHLIFTPRPTSLLFVIMHFLLHLYRHFVSLSHLLLDTRGQLQITWPMAYGTCLFFLFLSVGVFFEPVLIVTLQFAPTL